MKAREYTRRVHFYETIKTSDGYGGNTVEDAFLFKSWAKVKSHNNIGVRDDKEVGVKNWNGKILVTIRHRKDFELKAESIFIMFRHRKYVIKNQINNNDEQDVDISFIAVRA